MINFDIKGLERPGESVPVVIPLPQDLTIPSTSAVWRKYIDGQWQDYVLDDNNKIESAQKNRLGI